MRIKNCILLVFGCLFLSFSAKADVTAIRLRFAADGTLTDLGTSLSSDSMALSAPIVETDGTVTDPVVASVATEGETDALFLTPDEPEEDDSDVDTTDPDDEEPIAPVALMATNDAGALRGAGDEEQTDEDSPCEEGSQLRPDGECMPCPSNGTITTFENDIYFCCGNASENPEEDKSGFAWQSGRWVQNINCGCPLGGHVSDEADSVCCSDDGYTWSKSTGKYEGVDPEACGCPDGGVVSEGECCKDGYVWSRTGGYTTLDVLACHQCPSGYTLNEDVCCDNNNRGTFLGMTTSTEDKDKAIRLCGCRTGETPSSLTEEVCCGDDDKLIKRSTSSMGDLSGKDGMYCGCSNGEYSESKGVCVSCLSDAFCLNNGLGKACLKNSDITKQKCVECTTSDHCYEKPSGCSTPDACCPASTTDKLCDTKTNTCKTCGELTKDQNPVRPVRWHGLDDVNSCNSCYECTKDEHCASRTDGKHVCDPNTLTCEVCVLYTEQSRQNYGCENAQTEPLGVNDERFDARYCVLKDKNGTRHCSECRYNADCSSADRSNCLEEKGYCSMDCGDDVAYNPDTGECQCSGSTPVFNIYTKKCVKCYDSISGAWTDLGCNAEPNKTNYPQGSPWNYSPWQSPKSNNKPVCWEGGGTNQIGECVECTEDGHCPGEKKCQSNHTCACPSETVWVESSEKCALCTANYGATSSSKKCTSATKPYCGTSGCTCKYAYTSSKKDGDGKCPLTKPGCKDGECQCLGNYDKNKKDGDGKCPEDRPKCENKECKCTGNWKDNQSSVGDCVEGMPVCDNGVCKKCGTGLKYDLTSQKCVAKTCKTGEVLSGDTCICPKGRWRKTSDNNSCVECPTDGSCTTINDIDPCPSTGKTVLLEKDGEKAKCVACTKHSHCSAGKYCKDNTCKKCDAGYDCGCGSYKCANGSGSCNTQLEWCVAWKPEYNKLPSENSACTGYVCCRYKDSKWSGATPTKDCTACSSGKACR